MQRLLYILFQLDEAARYIEDGRLERLRLALLILDNAAEIQLERRIQYDIHWEEYKERQRASILQIPEERRSSILREAVEWQPLPSGAKRRIARFFDEKLKYLVERQGAIDARLAAPLSYLHKYRNEAYHHSRVRRETISTAATLLLDINCELLTVLKPGSIGYASDEDYSWFRERFDVEPHDFFGNDALLVEILAAIKRDLLPTPVTVKSTLVDHLESRFEELMAALDFVVQNTHIESNEEALRIAQYTASPTEPSVESLLKGLAAFEPPHTLASIEELRARIPGILAASERLEAFQRFSEIEALLEAIEQPVINQAVEVDHAIQMEIDIARGK